MVVDNSSNDITNSLAILLDDETNYQCRDYLKDDCNDTSSSSTIVTGACRAKVVRWLLDTVKCLKMSPDTAVDAISNLDRAMCVSSKARSNRKAYQLGTFAMCALSTLGYFYDDEILSNHVNLLLPHHTSKPQQVWQHCVSQLRSMSPLR